MCHILQGSEGTEFTAVLTNLFREIDDGDGLLTTEELIRMERTLGVTMSRDQAEGIIQTYDSNGHGKMDLEDFILYKKATFGR